MSEKNKCRICSRVERRPDFVDVFENRFRPDKISEEIFLCEAMQQLTGIEINEITPTLNKVCTTCKTRVEYAYRLRLDIIETNDRLLVAEPIKLAKLESDTATEVFTIVDLDIKSKQDKENFEFVGIDDASIDVEYLVEASDGTTQLVESPEDGTTNESDEEYFDGEANDAEAKVDENNADNEYDIDEQLDGEDEEQDAVSFLLGNSHLLDKMSDNTKRSPASRKRPHICKVCDKTFLRKSNLIDHLRLHANLRLYQCEFCDKSFVQAGNFKSHLRIHTKERPFQCSVCPKTYNQSSALKVHMRSHTNERNYICEVCNKAFTNSSDLSKHRRVHDPSQKLKCNFCEKTFAQKVNLRNHMRKHHPGESLD